VRWSNAFPKCLLAGGITALAVLLAGHVLLILIALIVGGALGVWFYSRGEWAPPINTGIGARIGAVTGLVGFGIYSVLFAVAFLFQRDKFFEGIKNAIQEAATRNPNPQAQQIVNQFLTPEGMAVLVTVSAVLLLFIFLIFCTIGGAVGTKLVKRDAGAPA
jgi:hypothetical protein